jgi:hypothetical protein
LPWRTIFPLHELPQCSIDGEELPAIVLGDVIMRQLLFSCVVLALAIPVVAQKPIILTLPPQNVSLGKLF